MVMQRCRPAAQQESQDDLYVKITYHPNAFYRSDRWQGRMYSDANDYSIGGTVYGTFEWIARWKAHRLLARKRRMRRLATRANEYGQKVIR